MIKIKLPWPSGAKCERVPGTIDYIYLDDLAGYWMVWCCQSGQIYNTWRMTKEYATSRCLDAHGDAMHPLQLTKVDDVTPSSPLSHCQEMLWVVGGDHVTDDMVFRDVFSRMPLGWYCKARSMRWQIEFQAGPFSSLEECVVSYSAILRGVMACGLEIVDPSKGGAA